MLTFACPACNAHLQVPPEQAGEKVLCPTCSQKIRIPLRNIANKTMLARMPDDVQQALAAVKPSPTSGPFNSKASSPGARKFGAILKNPRLWLATVAGTSAMVLLAIVIFALRSRISEPEKKPDPFASGKDLPKEGDGKGPRDETPPREKESPIEEKPPLEKKTPTEKKPAPKIEPRVPLKPEELVARAEKAVAVIDTPMGHGTGFLIGPGLLATNAHVVENALVEDFRVYFPATGGVRKDGLNVQAIAHFDPQKDLAFLVLDHSGEPLPLLEGSRPRRGQNVLAIGSPGLGRGAPRLENVISRGTVGGETDLFGARFLQVSISVNPGNSGGPILDDEGKVAGMITLRPTTTEGIAFALPAAELTQARLSHERDQEKQRNLTSWCNARAVVQRTLLAAKCFQFGVGVQSLGWEDRWKKYGNILPKDFQQLQKAAMNELLRNRVEHYTITKDLEAAIGRIGTDPRLAEATRGRIADLWKTMNAFRNDFVAPLGNLADYRQRLNRNTVALEDLASSLSVTFNVPQHRLDLKLSK